MKNNQKGFVVPMLIVFAVLILGGGAYFYSQKTKTSQVQNTVDTTIPTETNQVQDTSVKTQPTLSTQTSVTNKPVTQSPAVVKKPTPPVVAPATVVPAKTVIANAIKNQSAMVKFRAMYYGTETASDGGQSQSISFWSQEDKQDSRMRYGLYKGVVYDKDSVTKGYIGTIAETMYHFLNNDNGVSVSCVNTDQFCQAIGNSFAEYFARVTASRGMELQSISKLFGLQVYGEPSLMNITSGTPKTVTYDSSTSGQPVTKSSICDPLNIVFSPTEVKKLASPSGQLSYETIDPSQSKFVVNICVDRTSGLVDEYSTDLTIVATDGHRQHTASNGKLLGYSTEVVFSNEFPFSSKVEQYNK